MSWTRDFIRGRVGIAGAVVEGVVYTPDIYYGRSMLEMGLPSVTSFGATLDVTFRKDDYDNIPGTWKEPLDLVFGFEVLRRGGGPNRTFVTLGLRL